jgi:hypothetical protein
MKRKQKLLPILLKIPSPHNRLVSLGERRRRKKREEFSLKIKKYCFSTHTHTHTIKKHDFLVIMKFFNKIKFVK